MVWPTQWFFSTPVLPSIIIIYFFYGRNDIFTSQSFAAQQKPVLTQKDHSIHKEREREREKERRSLIVASWPTLLCGRNSEWHARAGELRWNKMLSCVAYDFWGGYTVSSPPGYFSEDSFCAHLHSGFFIYCNRPKPARNVWLYILHASNMILFLVVHWGLPDIVMAAER